MVAMSEQETIRELRVTINVLTRMLVDAGVIDEDVLRARIEAGLDDVGETNKIVECMSCKQRVPVTRTQHTPAGFVCDECTA